jgi:glyoxylase-like metal-dependent hydrolase (beta-lactamase superfamily II)
MIIDTAFGLGNLRGLVDEITGGMPLVVVNTHTGPDHVLGNVHFETVYCHEYEVENIRNKCRPDAWDYLFDENGENIWLQFDKKDLPQYKNFQLIGVPDGHVFDLGGDYHVELVWTAGHAPGHAMFLDKKGRSLFAGDDICSDVIGCGGGPRPGLVNAQYSNLSTYRDCLEQLVKRLDEFDYIFPGHFVVNLENYLLLNVLDTLNSIINDPECYDYKEEHLFGQGGGTRVRMHKFVKGFGSIAYMEKGVYPPE